MFLPAKCVRIYHEKMRRREEKEEPVRLRGTRLTFGLPFLGDLFGQQINALTLILTSFGFICGMPIQHEDMI